MHKKILIITSLFINLAANAAQYKRPFFYRDGSYKEPLYYDFYDYGRPYYQYNVTPGIMYGYH